MGGLLSLRCRDQKELVPHGSLFLLTLCLLTAPSWSFKPAGEGRLGENACSARRGRELSQVTLRKLGQPPSWAYPGSPL